MIETPNKKTALITGASFGIGYELAKQFGRGGYDLVLVARDKNKLSEVATELTESFGVDVGVLPKDLAVSASVTGPMLRASGGNYDIRKVDGYSIYPRFSFKIPLGEHGDVYDRYYVRILEMRESVKILEQALKEINTSSPHVSPKGAALLKAPRSFRPPKGQAYARIESPKGELGFYLVSDGTPEPYRYHVRAPSFINLTILEDMCLGQKVADAIIILGSVDIVLGEVDR